VPASAAVTHTQIQTAVTPPCSRPDPARPASERRNLTAPVGTGRPVHPASPPHRGRGGVPLPVRPPGLRRRWSLGMRPYACTPSRGVPPPSGGAGQAAGEAPSGRSSRTSASPSPGCGAGPGRRRQARRAEHKRAQAARRAVPAKAGARDGRRPPQARGCLLRPGEHPPRMIYPVVRVLAGDGICVATACRVLKRSTSGSWTGTAAAPATGA
jgi:hypothetical protein